MTSRTVHPCYMPTFPGSGAELAVWAQTLLPPSHYHTSLQSTQSQQTLLITAQANSLRVYLPNEVGELVRLCQFDNLAGNIIELHVLNRKGESSQASASMVELLIGFAGLPRLSVVQLIDNINYNNNVNAEYYSTSMNKRWQLKSTSIVDFTSSVISAAVGAMGPLSDGSESNLMACVDDDSISTNNKNVRKDTHTAAVVLGGGVAIAAFQIVRDVNLNVNIQNADCKKKTSDLYTEEPFVLNLQELSHSMAWLLGLTNTLANNNDGNSTSFNAANMNKNKRGHAQQYSNLKKGGGHSNEKSISTGFGDILDIIFLTGYSAPTIAVLHAPRGQTWSGRMAFGVHPLAVTAIALTIEHKRAVVLWSCGALPCDARSILAAPQPVGGCLVISPNSIAHVHRGKVHGCLAVNGFAHASAPQELLMRSTKSKHQSLVHCTMGPNPSPLPRLAIQLDGSRAVFVAPSLALIADRGGTLFSVELHPTKHNHSLTSSSTTAITATSGDTVISLVPLGMRLASPASNLVVAKLPKKMLESAPIHDMAFKKMTAGDVKEEDLVISKVYEEIRRGNFGILFCGSRLGDSTLLAYSFQNVQLAEEERGGKVAPPSSLKRELEDYEGKPAPPRISGIKEEPVVSVISDEEEFSSDEDKTLAEEEASLYQGYCDEGNADSADEMYLGAGYEEATGKEDVAISHEVNDDDSVGKERERISSIHNFDFSLLDSIPAFGCLGEGFEGPTVGKYDLTSSQDDSELTEPRTLANDRIFPCGFGRTGGLAILSCPGNGESCEIVDEADLVGASASFFLSKSGLLLVLRKIGQSPLVLRRGKGDSFGNLSEVSLEEWCAENPDATSMFHDPRSVMLMNILSATEVCDDGGKLYIIMVACIDNEYSVVVLTETKYVDVDVDAPPRLCYCTSSLIESRSLDAKSVSVNDSIEGTTSLSIVWVDGAATFVTVQTIDNDEGGCSADQVVGIKQESIGDNDDPITAMDVIALPQDIFAMVDTEMAVMGGEGIKVEYQEEDEIEEIDPEDGQLYGQNPLSSRSLPVYTPQQERDLLRSLCADDDHLSKGVHQFAFVCHASGALRVHSSADFVAPVWEAKGCGYGESFLSPKFQPNKTPNSDFCVKEIRAFIAGPLIGGNGTRRLCLVLRNVKGDVHLYSASNGIASIAFCRENIGKVCRASIESEKHILKLKRKGMIKVDDVDYDDKGFQYNTLHRFKNISGNSGLFSAGAKPLWFVAERGSPMILQQRLRFAAAGSPRPVTSFCVDSGTGSFLTIHERIGRVGSQRLTIYTGLGDALSESGFLPGGGLYACKIPLGVTVRQVSFINDDATALNGHPLYAMIVSRHTEQDQSDLFDDGLTPEERQKIQEEREAVKTRRQVEADLGGFDVEQEWVEEIERDDVFEINKNLGGAPSISKEHHEVWLVDANGWKVRDRFLLDEYEHALSLQVLSLSEVQQDKKESNDGDSDNVVGSTLFVIVGTGKVDEDGEDVSSRGRVILFEVVSSDAEDADSDLGGTTVKLSLTYEKEISLGPVTCMANLEVEGKSRLVVGAGAEVTIEQWNGKFLQQVGFFHANMQVQNITLMKTFFLLSDAYDSLHFLVWRESDKSLTLLAKDYEPAAVVSAGIISRGGAVSFICHDDRENIQSFQYAPNDDASRGGNKLVLRGDFHLGSQVIGMNSHWCRSSLINASANQSSTWTAYRRQDGLAGMGEDSKRFGVHFGTTDGSFGTIVPVSDQVYWRMTALQSIMSNALEFDCGCNPLAWRLLRRTSRRGACQALERKKGFLDGLILSKFVDLGLAFQEELASAIGSTVDLILDNLTEVESASVAI